ncbi:uncharacterized protein LOC120355056 isoform X1 [Nilaparvata lugens]|uniref:uncharacterized protein LOC120355056 isoform X1 n=1 Tax=Nilaparvata lugens TaxID=108931 RepID=UPI00193D08A2|nr:uncharacterized protein LOC120355056 isoform X1 [Nilaparvata lugens]
MEQQHKVSQYVSFGLGSHAQSAQRLVNNQSGNGKPSHNSINNNSRPSTSSTFVKYSGCLFCNDTNHNVFRCNTFLNMAPTARLNAVQQKNLCRNCLRPFSKDHQCFGACRDCGKAHHSLLHFNNSKSSPTVGKNTSSNNAHTRKPNRQQASKSSSNCCCSESKQSDIPSPAVFTPSLTRPVSQASSISVSDTSSVTTVVTPTSSTSSQAISNSNCAHSNSPSLLQRVNIMPTAQLHILSKNNQVISCRALLDTGSDACFISKALASQLDLDSVYSNNTIHTVSGTSSAPVCTAAVLIHSPDRTWSKEVSCILTEKITPSIPPFGLNLQNFNIPPNVKLADPEFHVSKGVDLLLSVAIYSSIQACGQIQLADECTLQNTKLGWVVWGAITPNILNSCEQPVSSNCVSTHDISRQLEKFWKIEEVLPKDSVTKEQHQIEKHYLDNVQRGQDGRFSVALPKKDNFDLLGQSRHQALVRFHSLEKRLATNAELRSQYVAFMDEYESLGHMSPVPDSQPYEKCFHIPHHPVFKPDSTTTKLRVVFDASAKSNTGISLNEALHVGHTVQPELFDIVLRFRTHRVAFIADITKMYRQILVHPEDRNLQRIFWRSNVNDPIQEYVLNTVSYGTSPAAFLATRTLNHLADIDCEPNSPVANAIKNDFYVDDFISGCSTVEQAIDLLRQIRDTLSNGGFELRKWLSNSNEVLNSIPEHLVETVSSKPLSDSNDSIVKALGLIWNSTSDVLIISSSVADVIHKTAFTKRELLSCIASIFDPLGLISPVVILPKMLFQKLWPLKLDWDQKLPPDLLADWLAILQELPNISNITIPRCILAPEPDAILELHAFADASVTAYGVCIYVRSTTSQGVHVCLLTAKSKLASLRPLLTIPRLELQAALLASRLVNKIISASRISFSGVFLWTDSKIVCDWLKAVPNRSDVFVSVRISEIQNTTADFSWNHVKTDQNPADLVSRGCSPNLLITSTLWWNGPTWLSQSPSTWNKFSTNFSTTRSTVSLATKIDSSPVFNELINKFSNYHKLTRTTAYLLRYVHNLRNCKFPELLRKGELSIEEIKQAELKLIHHVQIEAFHQDICQLKANKPLLPNSRIRSLTPFIHSDSLLRVGGRLQESKMSFDFKHQILLPAKHKLTRSLINSCHRRLLHAGVQSTMASIRQKFWILSTRRTVKSVLKACITCFRFSSSRTEQIMGNLPAVRIQTEFPFYNSGIDYAGPFNLRLGTTKSRTYSKAYLAVFVCMATRAVHVEVVSELSTKRFIDALIRFTARRGIPFSISSDNATTFVGANNELKELCNFFANERSQSEIQNFATLFNISWRFIPPRAPHFGGLWENAIKNFKRIFKTISFNKILDYEDATTFSAQVEAILNSRPLIPLSEDPEDLQYISPGHFLIGRPITALPFPLPETTHIDHRSRWKNLALATKELWKKWSTEYLVTLQTKAKWTEESENLKVDTIVLLKDPGTVPSTWRLARIVELHPGKDQKVRVVTVLTETGLFKRAISSIAPLPQEEELD